MKWYYIISFDKSVIELKLSEQRYKDILESRQKGGILVIKDLNGEPRQKNANSISEVLTEQQYKSWLDQTNPEKYLLKGLWFARNDKTQPFRTEPWKQNKLSTLAIVEPHSPMSDEERQNNLSRIREIRQKLKIN